MSFVGGGEAQCRDLLIKSKWDLQSAINGFFDSSSSRGGGGECRAMIFGWYNYFHMQLASESVKEFRIYYTPKVKPSLGSTRTSITNAF